MGRIPSPAHVLLREYRINQSVYSVIQLFVLESLNKLYHKFIYPQIVFNSSTSRAYSEIPKVYDAQRGINYDINCTFADGEKAQVEMQSWDEWRWIIQGQIEGKKRDYTSGLLAAERRGAQQNARENAKNLLKEGDAPEKIARCCSLPLEEVLALKEQLAHEPAPDTTRV